MDNFKKFAQLMELKENMKDFIEQKDVILQMCDMVSQIEKMYYDALIKEGFTEVQAMCIVSAQGINVGKTNDPLNNENNK